MPLNEKGASVLPGANQQKGKQMNRVLKTRQVTTAREKPQHPSSTARRGECLRLPSVLPAA